MNLSILNDISLKLTAEEIWRHPILNCGAKSQAKIRAITEDMMPITSSIVTPIATCEIYPMSCIDEQPISLENNTKFHSRWLAKLLKGARQMVITVYTIGSGSEEQVTEYLNIKDRLRGMVLDHIGTLALNVTRAEICHFLENHALSQSYRATGPLGPGDLDWPVSEQRDVFDLVDASRIKVSLTPQEMMVPH